MGTVSQSFLQYYLHCEFATLMVLTKGMPNSRELCIFLIFHGTYVMFDVKKKQLSQGSAASQKRALS